MSNVHPTAIVGKNAKIGNDCSIGPYSVIGDEVELGDNVTVESHVVIEGDTSIGDETVVFPFASIGLASQDLKYKGEPASTVIGKRNTIREFVTVHKGTAGGGSVTKLGDDNLIMAQAHVAHDCQIGNGVILANAATLAGHVEIDDRASIGAHSGIHQFCNIGLEAFVGGYSVVVKDAMPYAIIQGNHAKCYGLNKIGMKRRNYSRETIKQLNHAFHLLLSSKLNTTQAIEQIESEITGVAEVDTLVMFIKESTRGVVK